MLGKCVKFESMGWKSGESLMYWVELAIVWVRGKFEVCTCVIFKLRRGLGTPDTWFRKLNGASIHCIVLGGELRCSGVVGVDGRSRRPCIAADKLGWFVFSVSGEELFLAGGL